MKVSRAGLILSFTLSILVGPLAAEAQPPVKVHRIGYLGGLGAGAREAKHLVEALRQGLRDLGYLEGKNLVIEFRGAEGRLERLPDLAAELVRLNVDVIVAAGTAAPFAAKDATRSIPIIMTNAVDPVGSGLVASLARPGGNITGLTQSAGPEIAGKQLELLREAVPELSGVAVLWNPTNPAYLLYLREAQVAARAIGVQLQILEARSPGEFDRALAAMKRERAGALLVLGDPTFLVHRTQLADLATKSRLPAMYAIREFVDAGGLMAYGASLPDLWRRAATYIDKILKGAKPGDLPVEQPTKFELVINLKTAKALGLTIPQSVLIRADEVIQ